MVAGVVLAVVLSLVNILLLFAVLRRLREYGAKLAAVPSAAQSMFERDNELNGQQIPEFTASTVDGRTITRDDLAGRRVLVGFFAPGCKPCHEHAPEFANMDVPAYAFVSGDGPQADELTRLLSGSTAVVVGEAMSGLENLLGVKSFPTFLAIDETGTVERATISLHDLQLSRA
ncbi:TlpA family protein disulfide reductase [Lentzea tibetensis]|nr:TlpA disulfide reductase family protein [Lentzea tibetensis]